MIFGVCEVSVELYSTCRYRDSELILVNEKADDIIKLLGSDTKIRIGEARFGGGFVVFDSYSLQRTPSNELHHVFTRIKS